MNIVADSQDILFLVLAFCALWITAFLTWLLYYIISLTRQAHRTMIGIKELYQKIENKFARVKGSTTWATSLLTSLPAILASILTKTTKSKKSKR